MSWLATWDVAEREVWVDERIREAHLERCRMVFQYWLYQIRVVSDSGNWAAKPPRLPRYGIGSGR